ncbi:MAG: hypothetical protein ACRDY0_05560, partial [Acidimicrobiales bacterium]
MRLDDFRVAVRAGDGLVARFASALLVVNGAGWDGNEVVGRLVEECRAAGGPGSAARLRQVVTDAGTAAVPAFSAVLDSGDGLAVFVHGAARVSISGGQPEVALGDQAAGSWGAHIHDRVASLVMGAPDAGAEGPAVSWLDLREGVVAGSGAALVAAGAPVPGAGAEA